MLNSINKIVKVMALSDVILLTGLGFFSPIFAIFIAHKITPNDMNRAMEVAGFATAIYWGVKSFFEIPFGKYLDRNHGEKDDFLFVFIGNAIAAVSVFGYIISTEVWHIYLLQAVYSLGMAMNIPGWTAIFTRHIDKGQEAFEWAARSTVVGIGSAVAGALGAIIAVKIGYNFLFFGVGVIILFSSLILLLIKKDISPRDHKSVRVPETKEFPMPYLPKE